MFDWDDLKCFLGIARQGSTIAAAKVLGTSQSTVQRRVAVLEQNLGRKLVARDASGYCLTEDGKRLLRCAERVEEAALEFEREALGAARDGEGVIRVTCPEPIVLRITQSKLLDRFHALHPGLRVEFVTSDRYLDLAKGEADVALRSGDTDDELVGRKVADSFWAVYASRSYLEKREAPRSVGELARHPLVAFDGTMTNHRASRWLSEVAPAATIAARNNSVLGLVYAVKAGLGLGALPTALGDAEEDLVRVLGPIPELSRSWRLLAHPDLRRTPRIDAFFSFILAEREALKTILTG